MYGKRLSLQTAARYLATADPSRSLKLSLVACKGRQALVVQAAAMRFAAAALPHSSHTLLP